MKWKVKYNPAMKVSADQVKKVASLANLSLNGEETEKYSAQLSKVLDYIDLLEKVDTSRVEPTFNVTEHENVMAEDVIEESLSEQEALSNADTRDGFFVTKGVFEEK